MTRIDSLPHELADGPFTVSEAAEVGLGRSRRDSPALERPFYGIRDTRIAANPVEQARQYLLRLKPRQAFSGVTALRLHGLPWQLPWHPNDALEVAVPRGAYAPNSRGVVGHRLSPHRFLVEDLDGLPVLEPVAAVMDVAHRLSIPALTGLMDALLTSSAHYPGLRRRPACESLEVLSAMVEAWGASSARSRARAALPFVAVGVDSYPESVTRAVLCLAGLPVPVIHPPVETVVGTLHPDGGWPESRVGFEYEGDHHRTDQRQWDRDIARFEALAAAGWHVIRVTARDLRPENRAALVARVAAPLTAAGAR